MIVCSGRFHAFDSIAWQQYSALKTGIQIDDNLNKRAPCGDSSVEPLSHPDCSGRFRASICTIKYRCTTELVLHSPVQKYVRNNNRSCEEHLRCRQSGRA